MRPLYIIALLLPTIGFSQPTILQGHLPQAGQVFTAHNDYEGGDQFLPTPASPTPQIWDYSEAFGETSAELIQFLPTTGIPGASEFPDATLALNYSFGSTDNSIFYSNGTDGFKVEGFYYYEPGVGTSITTRENDIHIPVPLTYGNMVAVTSIETQITIPDEPGPALMHLVWTDRTMTADAHGTIITPAWPEGVEVVRHRYETFSVIDSSFIDMSGTGNGPWTFDTTTTSVDGEVDYNFLRAGQPAFVMEINGDGSFAVYYDSEITTAVSEAPAHKLSAQSFPNPATDQITIVPNAETHQILITDITGQLSGTYFTQGAAQLTINTEGRAAGAYTFRCLNAQGHPVRLGRFVVVR